jgi:endosialidase-like protein
LQPELGAEMKKLLVLILIYAVGILCAIPLQAQNTFVARKTGSGPPTGTCTVNIDYLDTTTGNTYSCPVTGGSYALSSNHGTCYAVAQGTATMDSDIRACDTALGHQGIIDATGYNANTTWAAAVTLGGTNICEHLILDQAFLINVTESDGGKALTVNGCSQLIWRGKVENTSGGFLLAAAANVACIVCEGLYTNSAGIIIEGGRYGALSGATVGTAMVYMESCFQVCEISNAEIDTIPSGKIGLLIDNGATGGLGAGPLTVHNVFVDANTVAAAGIKVIANGTTGVLAPVIFEGGGCVHNGTGNPCVDIEGGSNYQTQAVSFFGFQLESSHSTDIGILCNNCLSFAAHGVFASAVVAGAAVIKLTGVINSVFIDSLDNFNAWTYAIDDVANSYTDTGTQAGTYIVTPSGEINTINGKVTITGAVKLSGLTNAATGDYVCYNAGVIEYDTATCTLSLRKWKQNIGSLHGSLSEVMKLKPVQFQYRPELNHGDKFHVGFIAEDVDKIDKRIAAYKNNGELESVDYEHITAIDTAAIQEMQKEIIELKNRLKLLEKK